MTRDLPKFDFALAGKLKNPIKLRLWMLSHLPMGLMSGMKVSSLDAEGCKVELKDRFWLHNPFRSVFWAVMGMAAELSTGALLTAWCSGNKIKYILTGMEGNFFKKVRGKSFYFCGAGREILNILATLDKPGDTATVTLPVIAEDRDGQKVAEFKFTWTLKKPET